MPSWIEYMNDALAILWFILLLPQAYLTFKTKDTRAMSFMMTIFYFVFSVVGFFYLFALAIANHNWAAFISKIILNSMYCSGYILYVKWKNVHSAKKMGITEEEYYRDHIQPKRRKKSKITKDPKDIL